MLLHQAIKRANLGFATGWPTRVEQRRPKALHLRQLWQQHQNTIWPRAAIDQFNELSDKLGGFARAG